MNDWGSSADKQEQKLSEKINAMQLKSSTSNVAPKEESDWEEETVEQRESGEQQEQELSKADASLMKKLIHKELISIKSNIVVQRSDPNSPLYSVKSFEKLNLRPELLKGIYQMGFDAPSKIQETALPTLLADPPQNMIAQSQSGTGKTAAFVLACLSRVDSTKNYPQVLILSPTYELALQTGHVAQKMATYCPDIKFKFAVRGEEVDRGDKVSEHIVIGTPGKILDWSTRFHFFDLKKITTFVLDEADVMIDTQGHQAQSVRIHKCLPEECQMMFFSATYDQEVMEFAEMIVPDPIIIRLKKQEESLENIKQYYIQCDSLEDKFQALSNIYASISVGQAIIFCHTRKTAGLLSERMSKEGHAVALLSGDLTVEQRLSVLNRFRDGKEKILITTNVCSRGIDIEQVTVVVNFDMPFDVINKKADFETYLHRIGRTGRFGKSGLAINMIGDRRSMDLLRSVEHHFGKPIVKLDASDCDEIEKIGH
ncbi:DEAD-box helicase Dbp80 [Nymphon striatum]|nr:DEAD-box helicase Dbp80 [Nymphon striatum]